MSDLLFRLAPGTTDLLFGEVENLPDVDAAIAGILPTMRGPVAAGRLYPATVSGTLAGITGSLSARYVSSTDRPVVSRTATSYQDASAVDAGVAAGHQDGQPAVNGPASAWTPALQVSGAVHGAHQDGLRDRRLPVLARHQDAATVPAAEVSGTYQDGLRDRRQSRAVAYQEARGVGATRGTSWQERYRDRRPSRDILWGAGWRLRRALGQGIADGQPLRFGRESAYQEAMRPPAGTSRYIVAPPVFDPCYLPDPNLVFDLLYGATPALLFRCELHDDPGGPGPTATVVVPVRRVYFVNNTVILRRVLGSVLLPVESFGMQLDADSWTWSFTATLGYEHLDAVQPIGGQPVELEAEVNGVAYRLLAERLSTDRSNDSWKLKIAGRGRNALLADPYAERLSFTAAGALTAQQLMDEALTDNGIPIGWTVEFGLEDWLVPGGTWAHQGTWLSAVKTIAEAAGGYVQPHPTGQILRVLPRYPSAPWDWAGLTPDFELPSAVTVQEALEWVDKPIYNRVFVSGERNGRLVRVTRAGTAGDSVAPTVVDPLITAIAAGRQRGMAVLADVGRQTAISLRLPVLSETGVIPPGALVRYLDGPVSRIGLVRTTSVSGTVQLRQTLGIETHVAP